MKESVLHKFFLNEISENELAFDVNGSQQKTGYDTISVSIEPMEKGEFKLSIKHLIKLCDAVLNGDIKLNNLNTIGLALQTSDFFIWESSSRSGKIISDVISDWDNEIIGFDITEKNVWHWRRYLETGFNNIDKNELDLKFRSKGKYLELYRRIDEILEKEWNPIGVSELVRDEYQSYVPQIFKMKKSSKTTKEIEDELYRIELQIIGLFGNRENCKRVSKLINELKMDSET